MTEEFEGMDYVNDLERSIRTEAQRALLADVDHILDRHETDARERSRAEPYHWNSMAYILIADRLSAIRAEIARELA